MKKQEIKTSYFNLIQSNIFLWKEDTLNTSAKKDQCNKILKELMDTSKKSVGHLTEEQTEIVRRYIGVYGKEEDFCEISEKMHVPFVFVQNQFYDATVRMISRIKHGYIIVKDALLSGELTQDELLKLQLIKMDYPAEESYNVWSLHKNGYETVKKFIESPYSVYSEYPVLVDYIHSLGLTFKEKDMDLETAKSLRKLMAELEYTTIKVDECDEIIKERLEEKQKLQATKKQLLEKIKELENKPKVNTIGTKK